MLRHIAIAAFMFAGPCFAQDNARAPDAQKWDRHDPFVIAGDDCGASRYAHLLGQSYETYETSLPANAVVHSASGDGAVNVADEPQRATQTMTLEYRPRQLNVVVDGAARILAIGCY